MFLTHTEFNSAQLGNSGLIYGRQPRPYHVASFKPKMLTFAALQMQPNQRHHQRPVLRLLMSMSQPDAASPSLPTSPALHNQPACPPACPPGTVSTLVLLWGARAILSDSIKTNALLVSRLAYYELPSCPCRSLLPASLPCNTLLLCLCHCHPSIDCVASCVLPFCFDKQPL